MSRTLLIPSLIAACIMAGGYLIWQKTDEVALLQVPEVPRAAVVPDSTAELIVLGRLDDPPPLAGQALRKEHNRLVHSLEAALDAWRAAGASLREAEHIEARILTTRHALGVLPTKEWHARMAELFRREEERRVALAAMEEPRAGPWDLKTARLMRLKHERLAGRDTVDYAALRAEMLDFKRRELEHTSIQRPARREQIEDELLALEAEFPDLTDRPAGD